ncbi:type VI secretion system baseplate subunit TssF [Enterobacter asburiae]|uniref:type VI secretion system baseplate subunit TssF n=1 Tax=Scandinavium sp. UTDF21-P1B TaxID=3446379 RepID=UPI00347F5360
MLSDRFLELYNDELRYLRESGQQFAEDHPQVAGQLGIRVDGVNDPFVERLLEGTAFLSARVHQRIDNEYPEFALQMLSRLAPLWYTPTPSIATVAFTPDFTSPLWQAPVTLPAGSKVTLADVALKNKSAQFVTGRALNLEPLAIESAECVSNIAAELPMAVSGLAGEAASCLRLRLTTRQVKKLAQLKLDPLHLTFTGEAVRANRLLETLLNHCQRVVLWTPGTSSPVVATLSSDRLRLAGTQANDALLPVSIGELPGSRLMREYFAAPSRFYSVELHGLQDFLAQCGSAHQFEVIFVLNNAPASLLGRISAADFHLFATPIINLVTRRCDPITPDADRTEHQIVVDRLNPACYEIHHLISVEGLLRNGDSVGFSMLPEEVQFERHRPQAGYALRWRPGVGGRGRVASAFGNNEVFITLSPGVSGLDIKQISTLSVTAMVCDRFLRPEQLQQPTVQAEVMLPVTETTLLRMPSMARPAPEMHQAWQAIQLVSVNPLRYTAPEVANCAMLLRHWLSLFAWSDDASQRRRISSLDEAVFSHCFEHDAGPGPITWTRGVQARLNVKADHHADHGAFLFGHLLHHALADYCQLNQTLRTSLAVNGEVKAEWGPQHGL